MWLLQHSLQDNPENVSRGNDSRIAGLIKQDSGFLEVLDNQLAEHKNDSFYAEMGVTFEQGDLYYAIHRSTVKISCAKQENGQWYVYGYLYDRYDYTEFITLMGDTKNVTLGTTANDLAHISQMTGAIQPYDIEIFFELMR